MSKHDDPAVEARGGEHPDLEHAKPGEPLREKPPHVKPAGDDDDAG